ncbi:MAG TPA: cellulase family glycosylhydrolase [Candidatus Acidoferrales bacterium]|nr:cellulase family glycosylhydrolase [Candidatus Acidoferrales bacterium]
MRLSRVLTLLLAALFLSAALQTGLGGSNGLLASATQNSLMAISPDAGNLLCISSPCAEMITGWLHTDPGSMNIYDSNGNAIRLQGVNVDGLDFGTGSSWRTPDSCGKGWSIPLTSFVNVASWGFNFVRIPISWENLEPTAPTLAANGTWIHHWNTPYLNELDSVVSQFGNAHIAVIFDFAQVDVSSAFRQAPEKVQGGECEGWGNPIWLYPSITSPSTGQELATAMCNFFNDRSVVSNLAPQPIEAMAAAEGMLALRYVNVATVIGIDMFNEPWFDATCGSVSSEGALLTSFYTKMGKAIAQNSPHLLLVFEDTTPGLMHDAPIISLLPSIPNAVYEFHIYTSTWATAQPYVQAFLNNAKNWEVPVWLGEFDAFEAGCSGVNCQLDTNWQADTQSLLTFCNSEDINWSYFSYYSLGTNIHTPVPHTTILETLRNEITNSPN